MRDTDFFFNLLFLNFRRGGRMIMIMYCGLVYLSSHDALLGVYADSASSYHRGFS